MTESEQLILQKLQDIEKTEDTLISGINKLLTSINQFVESNTKKADETLRWAQEFHKMLIDEYAAGAQGRVFALVFVDLKSGVRKLIQVISDDMEKAYQIAHDKLLASDLGQTDWVMEMVSKQLVPLDKDNKVLEEVEDKMKFDRPLDVYINSLLLARDKFAKTVPQKKAIDNVVEIIRQTNGR
jgi:hypothetical protein